MVSHRRYVTFQMAEIAVPDQMFAEILSLTARLREPPTPGMRGRQEQNAAGGHRRGGRCAGRSAPFSVRCRQPQASIACCQCRARFPIGPQIGCIEGRAGIPALDR